ncbi:MAG: hypothetical protein Q4C25_08670 [Bacillota bacterium]|nr:hypothetical protein [Bacillota bacterium]
MSKRSAMGLMIVISRLLEEETRRLTLLHQEHKTYRGGKLYVREKKGKLYFSEMINGKEKGISNNDQKVLRLARKAFLEKEIQKIKSNQIVLKKTRILILKNEEKFNARKLLNFFGPVEQIKIRYAPSKSEWMTAPFESNNYKPEALRYATTQGIKMRSKSERIIGNKLEEYGIAYRYEPKMIVNNVTYYPDFVIMRDDGVIIIWEHLGLMDNEEYYFKACRKISNYNKIGFKQYKNLICTYEDDLDDMGNLDEIIEKFLIA